MTKKILHLLFIVITFPILALADDDLEHAKALSHAYEKVAAQIRPAVVNISTARKTKPTLQMRGGINGGKGGKGQIPQQFQDFLKEFYGEDFMDKLAPYGNDRSEGFSQEGMGTGVIIDNEGHIITNNHVIGESGDSSSDSQVEVTVRLDNEKSYKAKVIGRDPRTDLAVIKIDVSDLKPAKLGDSDKLEIGEIVVAAGNPFGLDHTVTSGIVSAKGRSLFGGSKYEDFIQTDAAINPGNSGGPLINLEGEVVGINSAIYSRSGGYMGIGFAIPINMAKNVLQSLIKSGKVVRGWLGVGIQNLSEDLAGSFNYSGTQGALVGHVDKSGPGGKAGLKQGDIITSFNGLKIKNVNQLRNMVAAINPGESVPVEFIRNGGSESTKVKIGELPVNSGEKIEADVSAQEEEEADEIGISVQDLTSDMSKRLKSITSEGVVVVDVRPGSPAAKQGIMPKDIIISVNGQEISDVASFKSALKKGSLSKGIRLVIESRGMERFAFLKE